MALLPDEILDNKYRIIRLLGEGGMGAVYEGLNTRIQRRVAIKVLHGNVASNHDAVQRFEREAQAAGRIGSKHIVQVLDLGDLPGGDRFMVMEYLDGVDLTQRIRSLGEMKPREVYPLAVQVLEGLIAAHDAGIVHRDLKPDNIFIVPEGETSDFVKILDFGISKFNVTGGEFSMTQTGVVMGTPYYMSPEQAKGSRDLDHRTDIYSLGVILYEALSGEVPHNAETFNALIIKIVLEDAPPLPPPTSDEEAAFQAIVKKALARDVKDRYQSAAEFQADLHDWAHVFSVPLSTVVKRRSNFPAGRTKMDGTQRTWATSTAESKTQLGEPSPPAASKKFMWIGLGAVVLIGGALAFALSGKTTAAEDSRALAPSPDAQASPPASSPPREPEKTAPVATAPDPKPIAEPAVPDSQKTPLPGAAEPITPKAPAPPARSSQAPRKTAPKTSPKAAPTTPAKAEPPKGATTSTGRTIRSTL